MNCKVDLLIWSPVRLLDSEMTLALMMMKMMMMTLVMTRRMMVQNLIKVCTLCCKLCLHCFDTPAVTKFSPLWTQPNLDFSRFPHILESPGFFPRIFQALESPEKSVWSWKVLKMKILNS